MSLIPVLHSLDEQDEVIGLDGERTIYNIPEANYPRFEQQIAKLSKKSVKMIGLPILPVAIGYDIVKDAMENERKIIQVYLQADTPKLAGYTFIARLDHSNDTGNIIRPVPNLGVEIPAAFRTAAPNCDHCGHKRKRRDTFLIRKDETGEFVQVGSTCLADFLGHDPYKIARLAEYLGYAVEAARGNEDYDEQEERKLNNRRTINLDDYLVLCAKAVLQYGWVSSKAARESEEKAFDEQSRAKILIATRDQAEYIRQKARYDAGLRTVTDEERQLVDAAVEWAQGLAEDPKSEYEHNVAVIANALYIEPRSCGLAASIVGVFYNNMRRAAGVQATKVESLKGLVDLLKGAAANLATAAEKHGRTPRQPKLRLTFDNGKPLAISLGKDGSKWEGTLFIDDGGSFNAKTSYGMVKPTGDFSPSRAVSPASMTALVNVLSALANKPAATAARYGHLTGHCCFCNAPLKDGRSTEVGYGPDCAATYNLPWGA
jgi:hypothetical protein